MGVASNLSNFAGADLRASLRITIALVALSLPIWAQSEPYLVKDINPTGGSHSFPGLITDLDGVAYFFAKEPEAGTALWRSDGTRQGTSFVADINPGVMAFAVRQMTASGGKLFFVPYGASESRGAELWVHDPDAEETRIVADLVEGPGNSTPEWLTNVSGTLYFAAFTWDGGAELWKSNGDAASTERVRDLEPGSESSNPRWLTACDGKLYFSAWTSTTGWALWRSDGTTAGTTLVHAGTEDLDLTPTSLTEVGGKLFFVGEDEMHGQELWLHDPATGNTGVLRDIRPGATNSDVKSLTDVDGTLFFVAYDIVNGSELWTSDGTQAGTRLVEDIRPGSASSSPRELTAMGASVYFTSTNGSTGVELWTSDGAPAPDGTRLVLALPLDSGLGELTEVNGKLYFTSYDSEHGHELWFTDGSEANTGLVKDIYPGTTRTPAPHRLTDIGGTLFFVADDGKVGAELWRSDGTTFGTKLVKDINPGGYSTSIPCSLVAADEKLYFSADGLLWVTDGTASKTAMLKEEEGGVGYAGGLFEANGVSFFPGNDVTHGVELWRSDGSNAGTVLVKDINPGASWSVPFDFTLLDGTLYFTAIKEEIGRELWRSDGTEAGTTLVADIRPDLAGTQIRFLTAVEDKLLFVANDVLHGQELWVHDPSADATSLVKDISPGSGYGIRSANGLWELNGKAYFAAEPVLDQFELWGSDGTEAGTDRVAAVPEMAPFVVATHDRLFFLAGDGQTELWTSDGTPLSTVLVKQLPAGPWTHFNPQMTAAADRIYLVLERAGVSGSELWTSDGTSAGTYMVKDIAAGAWGSDPHSLTYVTGIGGGSDLLFFSASDRVHGCELWVTDGTENGTRMIADLWAGVGGSDPLYLTGMLNTLYFAADDGVRGEEVWAYSFAKDADGDGLPDEWELNGYTHVNGQFVDLPALGANWQHKDLFVEIDYMKSAEYDHKPDPEGLAEIVAAFDRAPVSNPDGHDGIKLHLNVWAESESVLAFEDPFGSGPDPNHYDWTRFDEIKAANFAKELEWSHHYCIFAHTLPTGDGTDSGLSRGYVANDFIVALGSRTNGVGTKDQQAGTFMHELGHNLGLGHGGTDEVNNKPNYLSVMNWNFQMRGLIHTDPLRKWDYSREALPPLDENQLWEVVGLSGTAISVGYGTIYWSQLLSQWLETAAGSAGLPIDWDGSGTIETENPIAVDLDKDLRPLTSGGIVIPGFEAKAPLRGASDWDRILFGAGRIGGGRPSPRPQITPAEEMDLETEDELRPDPPGKVHGHVATGKIVLTWKPAGPRNAGIVYRIYRRGDGAQGVIGTTELSTIHDRSVVAGKEYVYSVTWVDAQGTESAPAEVTLTAK